MPLLASTSLPALCAKASTCLVFSDTSDNSGHLVVDCSSMLAAGPTCECTPVGSDGGQAVLYQGPVCGKGGYGGAQIEGNAQAALLAIQEDLCGIEGLQGSQSNILRALLMPARSAYLPLCCLFRGLGHPAGQLLHFWLLV